jgi:hypothetical protein
MLFYGIIPARIMGIRFSHSDTEENKMSQSEVARLLQEIELSYQAAKHKLKMNLSFEAGNTCRPV